MHAPSAIQLTQNFRLRCSLRAVFLAGPLPGFFWSSGATESLRLVLARSWDAPWLFAQPHLTVYCRRLCESAGQIFASMSWAVACHLFACIGVGWQSHFVPTPMQTPGVSTALTTPGQHKAAHVGASLRVSTPCRYLYGQAPCPCAMAAELCPCAPDTYWPGAMA